MDTWDKCGRTNHFWVTFAGIQDEKDIGWSSNRSQISIWYTLFWVKKDNLNFIEITADDKEKF